MKKYVLFLMMAITGLANADTTGIFRGSDVEGKLLRPPQGSAPISKREYEESLKKQGKTLEGELKRVSGDKIVSEDGFIGNQPGVNTDKKDLVTIQMQQRKQEIEEAKVAAKIDGIPEGSNALQFEKMAQEKMNKSLVVIKDMEKLMYTKSVTLNDYEKVEMQNKLMNILIEANYSKEISRKADLVKVQVYTLLRQMYPFVIKDSIKSVDLVALGDNYKVLKVSAKGMNSKEVLGLSSVGNHAYAIGFDKIYFTDNVKYFIEDDFKSYIQRMKEADDKNKKVKK